MIKFSGLKGKGQMYFDRFDICEAYWLYATLYHGGMWTKEYAYLGRMLNLGFKPRALDFEKLTENSREIYRSLVTRNGFELEEDAVGD